MPSAAPLREKLPGLACGRTTFVDGFAKGVVPPKRRTVNAWAAEERMVSADSGSPYARGKDVKYLHRHAPHMVEVMECLSLSHPAFEVTMVGSAQTAKSEGGLNLLGQIIDDDPSPCLVLLPSLDEQKKYVRVKLNPMIDATPSLKAKVRATKARDEDGSTTSMKRFRGGYLNIATASSSKALQMVSYRIVIGEEVSEWPEDVGERGNPQDQAIARTKAYRETSGAKCYWPSTPGIKGACRITAKYEAGDQRRRYVACPECGAWQVLEIENLRWVSATAPHGAYFVCAAHGCCIEQHHKERMMQAGVWLKTYPADPADPDDEAPGPVVPPEHLDRFRDRDSRGREPSFHIWQAYSVWVSWDTTAKEKLDAGSDPEKLKVFFQQTLGRAWEEKGDGPPAEKLVALVEDYPSRQLPDGALFITGFCDVQGHALKGDVYAWGAGMECWHIDGFTIEGDPTSDSVWAILAERVRWRYPDTDGRYWPIDAFGVDSGYISHRVYKFARDLKRTGFERVFATDGRHGPALPPIGTPSKVDIKWNGQKLGKGLLWPIGTWPMKLELMGALNRRLGAASAPLDPHGNPWRGLPHFNRDCDLTFFQELTAEYLKVGEKAGRPFREWIKTGTNDRLDTWVGSRALAAHVINEAGATPDVWAALAAARRPAGPAQTDMLSDLPLLRVKAAMQPVAPPPQADAAPAAETAPPPPAPVSARRRVGRSSFMSR